MGGASEGTSKLLRTPPNKNMAVHWPMAGKRDTLKSIRRTRSQALPLLHQRPSGGGGPKPPIRLA